MTPKRVSNGAATVDVLWLHTLERVAARAAHEIRGALNGVVVNLEVVRTRAEKPDAAAASVSSFATAAANQLEAVVEMTDAMLVLTRPSREPADIGTTVQRLAALLRPAARSEGVTLQVSQEEGSDNFPMDEPWARGNVLRLAIASALLAGIERRADVCCRIGQTLENGLQVEVTCAASVGDALVMDPAIADAVRSAGVHVGATSQGISLAFPRHGGDARERA